MWCVFTGEGDPIYARNHRIRSERFLRAFRGALAYLGEPAPPKMAVRRTFDKGREWDDPQN